jgi:cellobiose transport system permease protein
MAVASGERVALRRRPIRSYWREYASIAPFYVLFVLFAAFPLIYALYLVTQSWDGLGEPQFVGLQQIVRLFTGGEFGLALWNTVLIFLMAQIPVVIGALIAAFLLSRPKVRAKGFYQTMIFLPQVTSLVAVAVVFQSLFSDNFGLINKVIAAVGLPPVPWLTNPWLIKLVIALTVVWRGLGYFMVVFLAGLAAVPREIEEAALIDGAGPLRSFWSVTLPLLRPTIVFVVITGTIAGFQIFAEPQVLFNQTGGSGGPGNAALTLMLLQTEYIGGANLSVVPDLGYATAIGWGIFVILILLALFNSRLLKLANDGIGES